jgi:hypothetical protein
VLDCDPAGVEAYAERARSSVAPWLSASAVPLGLRLSSVAKVARAETGAKAG